MTSLPPLEVQLVLELKCREPSEEWLDVFPCGRRCGLALPLHQDLTNASSKAVPNSTLGFWSDGAVVDWWQHRWSRRRWSVELLEDANVKDIMETGVGW